jgi:CRISPR-associated protein Cmx8
MAKAKRGQQPESITVRYDLHELPTAQHKAGLAGLLLQIESMSERRAAGVLPSKMEIPKVEETTSSSTTISFSETSMQALFDDLYSAEVVEAVSSTRWPGATPKEERPNLAPKEGEPKKWFIYDVVEPVGPFFRRYTDDGKEVWQKLWRNMIWTVPRGRPTTRTPFNSRAAGDPTKEGNNAWKELVANERAKLGGGFRSVELAGAIMIGAQAVNAEAVAFEDRADHALLLHFWMLTVRIFVPEAIDSDGKREFVGFVLAFPDVSDLTAFCRAYVRLLGELKPEIRGYRPAEALISIPDQGALEFMRHLADMAERTVIQEGPARFIAGVEFFHLVRVGQNVKMAASGRIPPRGVLLQRYAGIRANYQNPLFQSSYLLAVIRGKPWFAEFDSPMTEREWSFFLHSTQEKHRTPPAMIGFAWEAHRRFQQIESNFQMMKEDTMTSTGASPDEVDRLVYQMIGRYAHLRTLARLRFEADDPKQPWMREVKGEDGEVRKRETPEYQDERRKVCSTLFLELRSRNDEDFVRHFTATLGSVPQRRNLAEDEFAAIAAALMRSHTNDIGENRLRTRDDVKTLTLLALSAHSRSLFARADAESGEGRTQETD